MRRIADLPTPALLVDLDKLEANIASMQRRADRLGIRLRPHVKTHKSPPIGRLQLAAGAKGITVATLYEAEAFAAAGFDDITWAFPVILSRVGQLTELAQRIQLGVVVDSMEAVAALAQTGFPHRVWIKVDCGYHRAGVDPATSTARDLATALRVADLSFVGLLSHSGDAYEETTVAGRAAVAERERRQIVELAARLRHDGIEVREISIGSTPSMTAVEDLTGITEARPGNYAYFDLSQVRIGSCEVSDCALTVESSVVSCGADHCVIDAGALSLSKDPGLPPAGMGAVFEDYAGGVLDPEAQLVSLSQEHGELSRPRPVGERVRVLPNHSCLAAACFTECFAVRGEEVVDRWPVASGR